MDSRRHAGDLDRDAVDRQTGSDRFRVGERCRNVEREWIGGRRAPAELTFEAVAPEERAAKDPVAADGEIVAPLLERLRDMDSALAQRVGRFVSRAIELLAVRDGRSDI